jgi:hypothetical protein
METANLNFHIDNSELMASIEILKEHAAQNPQIWECFDARFPNHADIIAFSEAATVGELVLSPSAAFVSFMQDLII